MPRAASRLVDQRSQHLAFHAPAAEWQGARIAGRLRLLCKLTGHGFSLLVWDQQYADMVSSSLVLRPQGDAASDRLRRRVLTPEQSLSAALRWRQDKEAVAAEQAAMWLSAGAGEAGPLHDAMDTDAQAGSAEDAQPAPQGAQGSVHPPCSGITWLAC